MEIIKLEFKDKDYDELLLKYLRGKVFHLTTTKAFNEIKKKSFILNNKEEKLPPNTGSSKSFGRYMGYVCLFDLRSKCDDDIEETLIKYNFLGPTWFIEYYLDHTELNLAYLIINSHYFNELVPNKEGRKLCEDSSSHRQIIPDTESWYPRDMPIKCVEKALLVNIWKSAPPKDSLLYAHHQLALRDRGIIPDQ